MTKVRTRTSVELAEARPSTARRLRHVFNSRHLWILLLLLVVGYLVLVPVASIIWGSLRTVPPGVEGPLTFENYRTAFSSPTFLRAVRNTMVFATLSTTLALVLGCYLAWVTERTNAPFRRVIYAFVLVPIIVPGVLTTIAWALVLNQRIGIANAFLTAAFGIQEPVFNAYTMAAMVWADGTDSITLPFLLMAAAFRAMDPFLEEASTTSGASHGYTLRHVTLPLMTPALLATALIVFIKTIDTFEVPAVMGLPGGIRVLATEVFIATRRFPVDTNLAAAYAVLYLGVALVGLWLYYRATNMSERFATITGKGYRPLRMDLRGKRYLHTTIALLVLCIAVVVPFLVMAYASLLPFYTPPTSEVWGTLTLRNYRFVLFDSAVIERALVNTVVAGGLASFAAVLLAAVISWVVIRTQLRGRRLVDAIAFAPIAFPGLVIALALMWFYLTVPVPIYATLWIIGIAYITAYMPYALRATHASLSQVSVELEEASSVSGASWRRTFFKIVLPLIAPGIFVGFVYVFSRTFKGLSLPILLAGPGTEVLPVLIFDFYEGGRYPELNALGMLMCGFLLTLSVVAQRLAKRIGHVDAEYWRPETDIPESVGR